MNKSIITALFLFLISATGLLAQKGNSEDYGKTLNLGFGFIYPGYIGHPVPAFNVNYEFDIAKNVTLAPSISCYGYSDEYYWGDNNHPYKYYSYRETIIPVGCKGTYYFDQLLRADEQWDFYAAATLGTAFSFSTWEDGYHGDNSVYRAEHRGSGYLFMNLHAGAELHMTDKFGLYLDLSTGLSTFGMAFHF